MDAQNTSNKHTVMKRSSFFSYLAGSILAGSFLARVAGGASLIGNPAKRITVRPDPLAVPRRRARTEKNGE